MVFSGITISKLGAINVNSPYFYALDLPCVYIWNLESFKNLFILQLFPSLYISLLTFLQIIKQSTTQQLAYLYYLLLSTDIPYKYHLLFSFFFSLQSHISSFSKMSAPSLSVSQPDVLVSQLAVPGKLPNSKRVVNSTGYNSTVFAGKEKQLDAGKHHRP